VAWLTYLNKRSDLYGGYTKLTKFLSGDPDNSLHVLHGAGEGDPAPFP
jgi:hypothetical protein